MSKSSIALTGIMAPDAFAKILDDLSASIKAGTVCLQKGGEFVTLKTAGSMEFEVEAGAKKGKQKLSISVKWEEPREAASVEGIKITSVEPEMPAEEAPAEEEGCKLARPVQQSPVEIPGLSEVKSLEQVLEEAPKPLETGASENKEAEKKSRKK